VEVWIHERNPPAENLVSWAKPFLSLGLGFEGMPTMKEAFDSM
jgi:hypothetical protein